MEMQMGLQKYVDVKDENKPVKDEKKPQSNLSDWNEIIITINNMILPEGTRTKLYDLMKLLLKEKHITLKILTKSHI